MNSLFQALIYSLVFCALNTVQSAQKEVVAETRLPSKFAPSEPGSTPPRWRYLLHVPADYDKGSRKWPMILFLHGRSSRGNDLKKIKRYGPPALLDKRPDFPFVVVSPQLPAHSWPSHSLLELIDEVTGKYRVDRSRVYLTGVSMGGGAAWYLAAADQKRFAAMIPLCGYGGTSLASKLTDLPIWAFHGEIDKITPLEPHQKLVEAVQKAGGNARLTIIPKGTHGNIIFPTYRRSDIYDWLLSHSRGSRGESISRKKPVKEPGKSPAAKPKTASIHNGYFVKKGDSLWRIAKNHGVSVTQLRNANSLDSDRLQVGQALIIPK